MTEGKLSGCWRVVDLILALDHRGSDIIRSLHLIPTFNLNYIGTREGLIHQLPIANLLKVAAKKTSS